MGRRSANGMRCGVKFSPALLYAYPVSRGAAFRPSGNPGRDAPEVSRISENDYVRSLLPQSKKEVDAIDAASLVDDPTGHHRRVLEQSRHWEGIRWKKDRRTPAERERDRRLRKQRENGIT